MWVQRKTMISAAEFLRRILLSLYERGLGSIFRYNTTAPDLFEVIQFLMIFSHYSVHVVLVTSSPNSGPGSEVGIATGYGLDGPVIESRLG
jgi:hypothetical protein